MDDTRLDDLLASAISPMPKRASGEATRLADATKPRRRMRRPWVVPTLVIGAIALTAGTSVTVATMSHWGLVSMPIDNVRNEVPIPVVWTTEDGLTETCKVWIELSHQQPGDRDKLDEAIRAHDWDGLGQRLYDGGSAQPEDYDGERRVGDALTPELQSFIRQVFPDVRWMPMTKGTAIQVEATGFRCVESR